MTKRYILLVGNHYYPDKWGDFKGTFDSVDEAKKFAEGFNDDGVIYSREYQWSQIIDGHTMKLVCECDDLEWGDDIWETKDD
jgi:hypothetical protein